MFDVLVGIGDDGCFVSEFEGVKYVYGLFFIDKMFLKDLDYDYDVKKRFFCVLFYDFIFWRGLSELFFGIY